MPDESRAPASRFRLLGPVEFFDGGKWATIPAAKLRTLLAILLLNANRVVPVELLVAELWADKPRGRAAGLLAGCVWRLRSVLGDVDGKVLSTHSGGYRITVLPGALDLHEYESLVVAGRAAREAEDLTSAAKALSAAMEMWRGAALSDVALTASVMAETARLDESQFAVAEAHFAVQIGLGRHEDVLPGLKLMVSQHPLRERLHEQLMLALYRSGQQAEALGAYRDLRHLLVDELGIEPSKPLRDLQQRILTEDPLLLAVDTDEPGHQRAVRGPVPSAVPARVPAPALPMPGTAVFVGRQVELAKLTTRLIEPGAVCSVYGLAGSGKSELAVRSALAVADRFPDGQVYVDLRSSSGSTPLRPIDLLRRLSVAFGLPGPGDEVDDLTDAADRWRMAMTGRRALIVLDDVCDTRQVSVVLPPPPGCSILLAGRSAAGPVDDRSHLRLGRLPVATSTELLRHIVGADRIDTDTAAAADVVRACECLPLALRAAAGKLVLHPEWTVTEFACRLARPEQRLDLLLSGDLSLRQCLRGGIRLLSRAGDDTALSALSLLSGLDLPVVPLSILATLLRTTEHDALAVAERLVDAGLIESLAMGSYRVPYSVRLLVSENTGASAEISEAVQRVVYENTCAVRACLDAGAAHNRLAWFRQQRAILRELAARDQTGALGAAVDELRQELLHRRA